MQFMIFFIFTIKILCSMSSDKASISTEKYFKQNLLNFVSLLTRFKSSVEEIDVIISNTIKKQTFEKKNSDDKCFYNKLYNFSKKIKLLNVVINKLNGNFISKLNFNFYEYNKKNLLDDIFFISKKYKKYVENITTELIQLDRIQSYSDGKYRFETKNSTIKNLLVDFKFYIEEIEDIYFIKEECSYDENLF